MRVERGSRLWEVEDAEYIPDIVASEAPEALDRAYAAGAIAPLRFLGVGAYGFVFCDANDTAFKVGRQWEYPFGRRAMRTEAEWLATASHVPWVQKHVARFHRFDEERQVLVRECVIGKIGSWVQSDLWNVHRKIESLMLPHGWSAPEFKQDSYVIARNRGAVLVDASMPRRVGQRLIDNALAVLEGREPDGEGLSDLAFYIRAEMDHGTIPRRVGAPVAKRLSEAYEEAARR